MEVIAVLVRLYRIRLDGICNGTAYGQIVFIYRSLTAALIPLNIQSHFIHFTHLQAHLLPCLEMLGNGDRALDLGTVCRGLGLPHAPVLIKGGISVNGGLIHSRGLVNVIGAPICIHRTQCRGCPRRSPTAPGFYDVVLDQGIPGPAVHAHVGVSVGLIIHTVFDGDIAQLIVGLGAVILLALAEQTVVDVAPLAAKGAPSGQGHAGVAVVLPQLIGIAVLGTGLVFGNDRGCGSGRQRCKGQAHRRRQQTVKKSADGVFSHVTYSPLSY